MEGPQHDSLTREPSTIESAAPRGAADGMRLDTRVPTPGCTWLKSYLVTEAVQRQSEEKLWRATGIQSLQEVVIVESHSPDAHHGEAWERLRLCESERLVTPVEARLVDDRRYAIFAQPPGVTLLEWKAHHPLPSPEQLIAWVRDLTEALTALHVQGLVHAHLDPEEIWVDESGAAPRLVLGGLDQTVYVERREPVVIEPDPFYAPPESLGDHAYPPGEALRAWDWWSVGRIVQELVLGRHILEHLVDHPLYRFHPEDREFAEKLLREQAHGNTRAGGVEAMPAMDKRIDRLLYGLLTAARDGRWGREDVQLWLDGAEPRERYRLDKSERLFRYRGRAYTVPEVAEVLRSEEHWDDAGKQLTATEDPASLIFFLRADSALRQYVQRLEEVQVLGRAPEMRPFGAAPIQAAMQILALQRLAEGRLVWKGRCLDEAGIRALLDQDAAAGDPLALLAVLCCPLMLKTLEKYDPTTARILADGSKVATKALELMNRERWMPRGAPKEIMRLWRLAFDSGTIWQAARQELDRLYARSNTEAVQALFSRLDLAPEEALTLAWMVPLAATRFNFVTHEAWGQTQRTALEQMGRQWAEQLFWRRLSDALRIGPVWWGHWAVVLAVGTGVGLVLTFAWPGWYFLPVVLLPLVLAVTARSLLPVYLQPLVARHMPNRNRWRWRDSRDRCLRELAGFTERQLTAAAVARRLQEVNAQLAGLTHLPDPPRPVPAPPHFRLLVALAALSWAVTLLPVAWALRTVSARTEPWTYFVTTWNPQEPDIEWYPAAQTYKVPFPFEVPRRAGKVTVLKTVEATPEEVKLANRRGGYYVQDYAAEKIEVPVLVRIPSDDQFAFMLYDAKRGEVMGPKVYFLRSVPRKKSFINLEGRITFVPDW